MQQRFKVTHQNYDLELNFKTQYTLEITAIDPISYKRYQNKNVEFLKIPKASILACLKDKNVKELKCKITQEVDEPLQQKDQDSSFLFKKRVLRFQFTVSLEYIQPFSQSAILYQTQSPRQLDAFVPSKLSKQDAKQVKRKLNQIQMAIPTGQQSPQDMFQYYDVSSFSLNYNRKKEDNVVIAFIAYNVIALIAWISYISFPEFLGVVLLGVGSLIIYFRSQKYLIKTITLKKGTYKVSISGQLTVQNYSQNNCDSFLLHAEFTRFNSKKLRLFVNSMNCYAYPFNGMFMIQSKKEQDLHIYIQKNAKFYPVNLQNVIISVDKVSHFSSLS